MKTLSLIILIHLRPLKLPIKTEYLENGKQGNRVEYQVSFIYYNKLKWTSTRLRCLLDYGANWITMSPITARGILYRTVQKVHVKRTDLLSRRPSVHLSTSCVISHTMAPHARYRSPPAQFSRSFGRWWTTGRPLIGHFCRENERPQRNGAIAIELVSISVSKYNPRRQARALGIARRTSLSRDTQYIDDLPNRPPPSLL